MPYVDKDNVLSILRYYAPNPTYKSTSKTDKSNYQKWKDMYNEIKNLPEIEIKEKKP